MISCRLWIVLGLVSVGLGSNSVDAADRLEVVRYVDLWKDSPARIPDAAGVTYVPERGRLLITDSEISEYAGAKDPKSGQTVFQGHNLFEVSLDASHVTRRWLITPPGAKETEPVGVAWDVKRKLLFVSNDDTKQLYVYDDLSSRKLDQPTASISTNIEGAYSDPEGTAVDPISGDILVVSGTKEEKVLRFRWDEAAKKLSFVSQFSVAEHVHDPEGIAVQPESGHIFLVSDQSIGEFTGEGKFVHSYLLSEIAGWSPNYRLPGGGTFAPSSDPNDARDALSLYVTCRGIDNGQFPSMNSLDGGLVELRLIREHGDEGTLRVPAEYATIQAAIDAANDGDTILVEPGTFHGSIDFGQKLVHLVSRQYLAGDQSFIAKTILDGQGGDFLIQVPRIESQPEATRLIQGFTLQNADDGITSTGRFDLLHCRVTNTTDGIDYEGGGGTVRYCLFDHNRDDAIDLDGNTAALIELNQLSDNQDDGIEIRLEPYDKPELLETVIRNNRIANCGEDGIQLIGYDVPTTRKLVIEKNVIVGCRMAGIGMMSGHNTREDYEAAPLPEPIIIRQNTMVDNEIHVSGGQQTLIMNNVFVGARQIAIKAQADSLVVSHNLFWQNKDDVSDTIAPVKSLHVDPELNAKTMQPTGESPVRDAGSLKVSWAEDSVFGLPRQEIYGAAPDLGALELPEWQQKTWEAVP
ncbi:DUF1565 domain-containing protein [Bremerella cremea]|uniref:Right handed beta helix domain-containing protein n=1 Tax=Blastopirellula marina TaxID=124 RepID=A0A2S8FS16_9BACT|nr:MULTISPECIES: right-handed parallel beta-helix repeat-containing protein [Pirellulaceae]PQO34972.1 hypothetical protein C5Y83_15955 [Blastopirellula marina]RCS47473.1 DUF1565 domain-containing protein [Bremerella cremea]